MECITSAKIRVLWNENLTNEFEHSKGIKQGDPLSPYIFVLCIERLSHLIKIKEQELAWKTFKIGRDGPYISHLLFADDMLLFIEASTAQIQCAQNYLELFC